ncbi:MAG: N-acetylmuramoyl-L-alanine amidase [Bacteroidota bacterium]
MEFDLIFPNPEARDTFEAIKKSLTNHSFEKFHTPIPGEDYTLDHYQVSKKDGDASYYYPEKIKKDKIVLHFTAGKLPGDMRSLTTKGRHISTAFLIGRDGTIYKLFASSGHWSYHLGRGAVGGNTHQSSRSIGIELSNWGPLKKSGDTITTWRGVDFAKVTQTTAYQELDIPFRDATYFATHTDQQYESLIVLLRYLTAVYNIPKTFLSDGDRDVPFRSTEDARNFTGICSHVNFRDRGKWDIGPAFNWEKLEVGMKDGYKPKLTRTRGLDMITHSSETEIEAAMMSRGMEFGNTDSSIYGEDGPEI